MTISLVAVFIPVLFMGGIVGRLLHEFAVTIAMAILISGFVSLTLTPMLGSRFLEFEHDARHGRVYRILEAAFNAITRGYDFTLRHVLRHKFATVVVALGCSRAPLLIHHHAHRIPAQPGHRSPAGGTLAGQDISFESMSRHQRAVADSPSRTPTWRGCSRLHHASNQGNLFLHLKDRQQRALSADQTLAELRPKLASVPGNHDVSAQSASHHHWRPE